MKTWEKILTGAVAILLAIALGFILNMYLTKPQIITNPVPTFFKGKDSVVTKYHYIFIKDTSKAEVKNDTAKATFNTTKIFDKDTLRLQTKIGYSLSDSVFNIDHHFSFINAKEFRVDTIKIQVPVEKVVYKDIPIWEKPYVTYMLGIITAVALFLLGGG